jgi:hypothetical protein
VGRTIYGWSRWFERVDPAAWASALSRGFVPFTPVAAVLLVRGGIWGIVLAVAAVGE